jgi:hypothetical protein
MIMVGTLIDVPRREFQLEPRSALIQYQLSETGQQEAIKRKLDEKRDQEQGGVITLPGDIYLFRLDSEGQLGADVPGLAVDEPPKDFEAALELLRRRKAEEAAYLKKQQLATGRSPTDPY